MHVTDWLPTLLEAVGLDPPQGIDGISHWRAFKDGGQLTRKEMLYNFKNISNGTPIAALRQDNWKYLSHVKGFDRWKPAPEEKLQEDQNLTVEPYAKPSYFNQLFDLASDPLEKVKNQKNWSWILSPPVCSTIWQTRSQNRQRWWHNVSWSWEQPW